MDKNKKQTKMLKNLHKDKQQTGLVEMASETQKKKGHIK
jgi:hypothetical protein